MLEKALRDQTGVAAYDRDQRRDSGAAETALQTDPRSTTSFGLLPAKRTMWKYRAVKAGQSAPPSFDMPQSPQTGGLKAEQREGLSNFAKFG